MNTSNLQGKLKEVTQMGAELIGDASAQADAEMIAMMIEALLHTGLTEFQVSVGQIEFFKGLCAEAGLDEDTELALREYISNRNYFGAEELLAGKSVSQKYIDALLKVGDMLGNIDTLQEAGKLVSNERSLAALARLEEVYDILKVYGVEQYVSFDLGMVSKYNYYTGVIAKAYTYGIGDAIAKGGRYDNLISQFGKEAPATGFVVIIDDLVAAISRQKITLNIENKNTLLLYGNDVSLEQAISKAKELRADGLSVILMKKAEQQSLKDYIHYAKYNHIALVLELMKDGTTTEERIS